MTTAAARRPRSKEEHSKSGTASPNKQPPSTGEGFHPNDETQRPREETLTKSASCNPEVSDVEDTIAPGLHTVVVAADGAVTVGYMRQLCDKRPQLGVRRRRLLSRDRWEGRRGGRGRRKSSGGHRGAEGGKGRGKGGLDEAASKIADRSGGIQNIKEEGGPDVG